MPDEHEQEFTVDTEATPLDCFATITDFERYPRWSAAVAHTSVIERNSAGIGRLVELQINLPFRPIRYVLEYVYRKPSSVSWKLVSGDIEAISGRYRFRKLAPDRTKITCRQSVRLGFWLPGPLRGALERTALRDSVLEFKREVERRLAASKRAGPQTR